MNLTESTPIAYGYSTEWWPAGSTDTSVAGNTLSLHNSRHLRADGLLSVRDRLTELFDLDSGWDGDSAPLINPHNIQASWNMVVRIREVMPSVQMPIIVPTSNGGVVLEWTDNGVDLSIEFEDGVHVFYDICDQGEPWEGSFSDSPINPGELLHEYFT